MQQGDEVRHTYNSTVHVYKFKQQCGKFLGAVYYLLVYAIMRFAIYKKSRKISYQNQVLRSRLCRGGVEVGGVVGSILSNRIHISQTLSKIGRGPGPPPPPHQNYPSDLILRKKKFPNQNKLERCVLYMHNP